MRKIQISGGWKLVESAKATVLLRKNPNASNAPTNELAVKFGGQVYPNGILTILAVERSPFRRCGFGRMRDARGDGDDDPAADRASGQL